MSNVDISKIQSAVGRVRRRLRTQSAVRWGCRALIVAGLILTVASLLFKFWVITTVAMMQTVWAAVAIVLTAVIGGACLSVDPIDAAQRLDRASDLKDRLSSALEFLDKPEAARTEFEQAQLRDALARVENLNYPQAAPWRMERYNYFLPVVFAAVWGISMLEPLPPKLAYAGVESLHVSQVAPTHSELAPAPDIVRPDNESIDDIKERIEDNSRVLDPLAKNDAESQKFIAELNKTLEALAEGKLTDRDVADSAAQLEQQLTELMGPPEQQAQSEAFEDKLQKVGQELKKQSGKIKENDLKELGKMIEQGRFDEAAKKLESLIELFKKLSPKQQRKIAKMFEHLAKKFQSKLSKQLDKLKKERRRLNRKAEAPGGLSKREKSRLNRVNKQLERLERRNAQQNKKSPARKELDRLSRNMRDLANKMRRQDPKAQQKGQQGKSGPKGQSRRMSKEDLKRLTESLKRAGKGQRRRRLARMGKMRLADLKEMLKQRQGNGRQGHKQLDRLARGKRSKSGKKGQSMSMGQGKRGKGVEWMRLNKVLQRETNVRMGRAGIGDGAGHGRNRMLQGRATDLKGARTKKDFVSGRKSKGPSRKEILLGAAEEGTRIQGYGKVHIDYSTKAAQQMKKESVPPGYREYVEQYFRLIRQR